MSAHKENFGSPPLSSRYRKDGGRYSILIEGLRVSQIFHYDDVVDVFDVIMQLLAPPLSLFCDVLIDSLALSFALILVLLYPMVDFCYLTTWRSNVIFILFACHHYIFVDTVFQFVW